MDDKEQPSFLCPISTNTYIMKNLITLITVLTITVSSVFASTTPKVLISTDDIEVVTVDKLDIFTSSFFNTESNVLVFDTNDDISVVQIFNDKGEMEFQLPVMSNNVQIRKNLFDTGSYKLGFVIDGCLLYTSPSPRDRG